MEWMQVVGCESNEFQIAVNQGAVNMVIGFEMQMRESFTGSLLKLTDIGMT
jgi:hypothetical protein